MVVEVVAGVVDLGVVVGVVVGVVTGVVVDIVVKVVVSVVVVNAIRLNVTVIFTFSPFTVNVPDDGLGA